MFVLVCYNDAYECLTSVAVFGPYQDKTTAKAALALHVEKMDDKQYKLSEDGLEAGFDYEELQAVGRNEELASEIYAEILPLKSL